MYGHVITKFAGMGRFTYPWCSAGALRAPELRYKKGKCLYPRLFSISKSCVRLETQTIDFQALVIDEAFDINRNNSMYLTYHYMFFHPL